MEEAEEVSTWQEIQDAQAAVESLRSQLFVAESTLASLRASSMLGGPDVSSFQGDVNWASVKADGNDMTIIKVSDGDLLDPLYTTGRVQAVRDAGLLLGVYYYARVATSGNNWRGPRTEAAMAYYFASRQGWGKPGDLPLVYDVEVNSGETSTFQGRPLAEAGDHITAWVRHYRALAGHYPIIYTNPNSWKIVGAHTDHAVLSKCALWIANYGVAAPQIPAPWTEWYFWQYTDKAAVKGISTPCDHNRVGVPKSAIESLLIR